MRHVAIFQDIEVANWPINIDNEYMNRYGQEALREANYGREAVFLGEWLFHHKSEFEVISSSNSIEQEDNGKIYVFRDSMKFAWYIGYNICKVHVIEIPENQQWIIDYDGCQQRIVILDKPNEFGWMSQIRVMC